MSLFHYTNAQAVHSILSNRKIWLTDIRYLNDSQELHNGFSILKDALKNPMPGLFASRSHTSNAVNCVRSMLFKENTYNEDLEPLYTFSLSGTNDLLSQWIAYGTYAIEFNKSKLENIIGPTEKCIYDENTKKKRATGRLTEAITEISNEMETRNGEIGPLSINALIKLVHDVALYKHEGFHQENEHRIISQSDHTSDKGVKYRTKDNSFIPHIEKAISLDCIKSIQVGPMKNQKLAYKSMKALAEEKYDLIVTYSDIPYRG